MSEKLKPCPFPHDQATEKDAKRDLGDITPFVIRDGVMFRAMCPVCGAHGPEEENEGNAIAAWNRRAPDPRLAKAREALATHRHTDACLRYAAQTGHPHCIAACADSYREALDALEVEDA